MRLKKLSIDNSFRKLTINEIIFHNLTLLVGVSGVGKTQIIKSIIAIKRIADGESVNGFNWNIDFDTIAGNNYIWEGGFEAKTGIQDDFIDEESDEYKKNKPRILFERIYRKGIEIVSRTENEIIFRGQKTVKLSQQESIVSLLKEEDEISEISKAFKKIFNSDQTTSLYEPYRISILNVSKLEKKYTSLESIQDLDEDIRVKLYLAYKNIPDVFAKIKSRFIEVFPQIEDIILAPIQNGYSEIIDILKEHPFVQIKEIGVEEWIHQGQISSGMFRTLMHISEMYLSAKGTVVLIDEFENSLGINCIDELTSDLVNSIEQKIQFIVTSHHPYIINNINPSNWKIVTRKAGNIRAFDAKDLNLGKSKHDAFMQLINTNEYIDGIES